jgi:hypothetical protein
MVGKGGELGWGEEDGVGEENGVDGGLGGGWERVGRWGWTGPLGKYYPSPGALGLNMCTETTDRQTYAQGRQIGKKRCAKR